MTRRAALYALLAVAVANISTASLWVRLAGVHGFVAATWRLGLSSILTLVLAFAAGSGLPRPSRRDLLFMAVSGVALALHFDLWMLSLFHLNVAPSVTIVDSYPALLAIAGRLLFGERYTLPQLAGAAAAMAGVAGLAFHSASAGLAPPGGDAALGAALAFAGMVAVAVYFTIGKGLRSRYSTLHYTLVVYSVGTVASAAFTLALGEPLTGYPPITYLYLVMLAVMPMLGGHTLINYALARLSLLAATIPVLGEPVGAALLAWAFLGESVSGKEAFFMAVTLTGIAAVLWGEGGGGRRRSA